MQILNWLLPAFIFGLTPALIPLPAGAAPPSHWMCGDGSTSVQAMSENGARSICDQGEKARVFLAGCGIASNAPLDIRVSREMTSEQALRKGGDFDPQTGRIRMLPLVTYMKASRQRFGTSIATARLLHGSIAAHEVAHGVFYDQAAALDLPETAHEYVAYVTQLSTLPVDTQRSIAEHSAGSAINNLFVFSFFLLRADPERFALTAWQHFHQPENGCAFLHRVLKREVHFPPPSD